MWEAFIVSLVMMVVSTAIQLMTAPDTSSPDPEAGKLDIPTAEEGICIPVFFGTNISKSSNVVWYGNASTVPIRSGGGKK